MISKSEKFAHKANIFSHIKVLAIGTKIFSFLCLESGFYQTRDGISSNSNVGKIFPIFHQDIIFWLIFFDKIGLQHQCLNVALCLNIVNLSNQFNHFFLREIQRCIGHKIRANTSFEVIGFSDIDSTPFCIFHQIDTRTRRKMGVEGFHLKI